MASHFHQPLDQSPEQGPPQAETSNNSRQSERRSSVSQASEDSQTVLLNHPSPIESSSKAFPKPGAMKQQDERQDPPSSDDSTEPKKCWICLQDETDDTPTSSQWRSPCSCRLEAHESCLLDWVAEIEKPAAVSLSKSKVECPQCKSPIRVIRPRSYFLEILKRFQRIQGKAVLPLCGGLLLSSVIVGCSIHGLASLYVIFGEDDFVRILQDFQPRSPWYRNTVSLSLPLIPVALLASRTSYADRPLSVLPLVYLLLERPSTDAPLWPPSAPMTLFTLPYLRAIYNEAYKYLFAEKEKTWLKELQPRGGDGEGGDGQNGQDEAADYGGNMNIDFGILVEVVEEEEEGAEEPPPQQAQAAPAPAQAAPVPPEEPAQADGRPNEPIAAQLAPPEQQQNQQNNNNNNVANAANAIPILVNVILEKAIGALIFPGVAAGMGYMLKLTLPHTWTAIPEKAPPPTFLSSFFQSLLGPPTTSTTGFLQTRFGRSIAGGCLFIVLRDSVGLYAKYKMAQQQRKRRIADYEGKRASAKN